MAGRRRGSFRARVERFALSDDPSVAEARALARELRRLVVASQGPRLAEEFEAALRNRGRRGLVTDPVEAVQRALAAGHSPEEVAKAPSQARSNERHARLQEDEEDRMVRQRAADTRAFWGLSREDPG
jgi:hypothetical protein